MGVNCINEGDHEGAFKYFTKAAGLGAVDAHFSLSILNRDGKGVEMNKKKEVYHLEEAAIGGHHVARYNLGCTEAVNGNNARAVNHFIIAAKLGYDKALDAVKDCFSKGLVSKEDYASALRGHQAAVDATKSAQRELASVIDHSNQELMNSW